MIECRISFFQAEDGIRDLVRSRGLGDVYKRQPGREAICQIALHGSISSMSEIKTHWAEVDAQGRLCLLYTSDACGERSSGDSGGRLII